MEINTKIEQIVGVGPKTAESLKKLGIETAFDLIYHFPLRYNDFSYITPISQLKMGQQATILGKIISIKNQRTFRKKMFITQALISDSSGSVKAIWFKQPYLTRILRKGMSYYFNGKMDLGKDGPFFSNPFYEIEPGIFPIYPETKGITSKYIRRIIKTLLSEIEIVDFLPEDIIQLNKFIGLKEAINTIHFPNSLKEITETRHRLAFDELFLIQLKALAAKAKWQKNKAQAIKFDKKLVQNLVKKLPFKLTNAQRRAAWEIILDLQKSYPMNRLLEGDVGSGKTVVAAIVMLNAAKNHFQSVLLAPTEILAIQHFQSLSQLLSDFGIKVALITHGKSVVGVNPHVGEAGNKDLEIKKSDLIKKIKNSEVDVIVGTHALLEEKIEFGKLALVVVDEQHRFGVKQRAVLRQKSCLVPHLLSMSATPIPRTLSLALYGDLDLSVLDEMPPGRKKVATFIIPPEKRSKAYNFLKKEIRAGRQVFVICPLIEESDKLGVKAATVEYEKLKKGIFPEFRIGLLHGKIKTKEKEKIMADFRQKKFDILVSTAVVEVGVDIPNASVMLIEGAERFGLAQLHQFRGRVGRGAQKSYCFLFTDRYSFEAKKRLGALVKSSDGFALAEKDLAIRGPGQLYGIRQHGFLDLKMASLTDYSLIKKTKAEAEKIIQKGLENYPTIKSKLEEMKIKSLKIQ